MTSDRPHPAASDSNPSPPTASPPPASPANESTSNASPPTAFAPELSSSPAPIAPAEPAPAEPAASPGRSLLQSTTFRSRLAQLKPLLIAEWPQLRNLDWSHQDLDAVITQIATHTRHTRTLIHHQISELSALLDKSGSPVDVDRPTASPNGGDRPEVKSEVDQWLDGLEARAEAIAQQLRREVWPEVRERAQRRVGPVLLLTLLAGVAIGWSLRGSRRGQP